MPEKILLHLLILCRIWSQEIIGTFADEEIKESSDFLVRQKRVVSHLPGEDIPVRIINAPYVVRIKEGMHNRCVGSILSLNVVITSTPCVSLDPEQYHLVSGAAHINHGNHHNVTEIRKRMDDSTSHERTSDGVALLIVNPRFVYTTSCQPIRLHIGPVLLGSLGKVHGWGYIYRNGYRGTNIPVTLRSIEVPIISHQNCVDRYRPHLEIPKKDVCTFHPQRHSGHMDFGAGLVVDGTLAGVFLWSGLIGNTDPLYPEVFAYLYDSYYNQWIRANVQSIDLQFQNHD